MRRTFAKTLLALACAASLAACAGAGPDAGGSGAGAGGAAGAASAADVDALVGALGAFTAELTAKVESAADAKAGAAEAQRLLDARRGEMAERIAALKQSPRMRDDAAARGRWLEAEVDNTHRVRDLKMRRLDDAMRDPELKAALERLAADYESMFKDR
ncbi:MAG TPA: hypothetical protein VF668_19400 [Pyrinomonadaceae bacterium]|jgi:transcriptional regulator of nitric oxide reductase